MWPTPPDPNPRRPWARHGAVPYSQRPGCSNRSALTGYDRQKIALVSVIVPLTSDVGASERSMQRAILGRRFARENMRPSAARRYTLPGLVYLMRRPLLVPTDHEAISPNALLCQFWHKRAREIPTSGRGRRAKRRRYRTRRSLLHRRRRDARGARSGDTTASFTAQLQHLTVPARSKSTRPPWLRCASTAFAISLSRRLFTSLLRSGGSVPHESEGNGCPSLP